MRVMLRAILDTPAANEAIKNGTITQLLDKAIEQLKPEAAYFNPSHGCRSCTLVFDMQDSSQLPLITESLFMELGAEIEIQPAMNREDLRKGLAALQQQS
ncbi:hypothetical protein [Streptomyces sp. NPDC019890]|uniref:hypothetical protein n=1 Tax=Streptomyces sp. NPDC019890 TaxID=3365064 RepID=UPI00384F21B7